MTSFSKLLMPVLAVALLASCDKMGGDSPKDFQTSETGLQYKIFPAEKADGDSAHTPKAGEVMNVHLKYDNGADSVLYSSFEKDMPIQIPVMPSTFKGSLEDGLMMLSPGDSAVFKVNADSLFAKTFRQPLPPFIKPGSVMTFYVKMLDIFNQEQAQAEQQKMFEKQQRDMMAHAEVQSKEDEALIKAYVAQKGLKAERTPSGLYYVITKQGTGAKPTSGQTVTVHYTGTTMDGKKFDSSVDRGQPFEFPLGQGRVIPGWDEGIALLNKGSKATFIIPSPMAYGAQSPSPDIPANSILVFDVELIDFK
ncbi:MAG: peptidylprolyl isomerase [Sphingobacteriales bacterium]|nr:MAG: peptidylprolyl isomerase [Sphingobacteriales bacterium]